MSNMLLVWLIRLLIFIKSQVCWIKCTFELTIVQYACPVAGGEFEFRKSSIIKLFFFLIARLSNQTMCTPPASLFQILSHCLRQVGVHSKGLHVMIPVFEIDNVGLLLGAIFYFFFFYNGSFSKFKRTKCNWTQTFLKIHIWLNREPR